MLLQYLDKDEDNMRIAISLALRAFLWMNFTNCLAYILLASKHHLIGRLLSNPRAHYRNVSVIWHDIATDLTKYHRIFIVDLGFCTHFFSTGH